MRPHPWPSRGQPAPFHDRIFRRAVLPAWYERWVKLSPAARQKFVTAFGLRVGLDSTPPMVDATSFTTSEREELTRAGFVGVEQRGTRIVLAETHEAGDFGAFVRSLNIYHPLGGERGNPFAYVQSAFATYTLNEQLRQIVNEHGFQNLGYVDVARMFVQRRQWPGWVAAHLRDPLHQEILDAIETAGGRLRLADLPARLPGRQPAVIRSALEGLVIHLALFEDVEPGSWDIVVGFLPATWEDLQRLRHPPPRPELTPGTCTGEVLGEPGHLLGDLRAMLLELAASPARIKQDRVLYKSDAERLDASLTPLPALLAETLDLTASERLSDAMAIGRTLGLLAIHEDGGSGAVRLIPEGQRWLKLDAARQLTFLLDSLREKQPASYIDAYYPEPGDAVFLGSSLTAVPRDEGIMGRPRRGSATEEARQRQPLREAVYAALAELPMGEFVRLIDFIGHTAHGSHNPLLLGRRADQVSVRLQGHPVLSLEQELAEAGERLLNQVIRDRLIPLGCMQAGLDAEGYLLIARRPPLEVYFGKPPLAALPVPGPTKIVVQPDFTIVVMGPNPAVVVDLMPFCAKVRGSAGSSSLTLRLTRDQVLKAIDEGLPGQEVVERLERLASVPLPGNVAHEVREWCGWVRRVTVAPASLVRCPDRSTADRVQSALGKKAERLNDTTVAFTAGELTSALKQKLQKQGVFVEMEEPVGTKKGKKGKKKR
jgi:hypothetical protein